MADISNVITVSLIPEGVLAQRDNLNVVGIITSETGFLSTAKRFAIYRNIAGVASDFGTNSQAYAHAKSFFATTPNPIDVNGLLVIGFWRKEDENVAATAATLQGAILEFNDVLTELQQISDGSFDIDIDGGPTTNVTGLDFRTDTSLADVVATLDAALTAAGVTVTYRTDDVDGIVFTSDTTGASSTLTKPVDGATGTSVVQLLGLADGTGSVLTQGADSALLSAETKEAAITEIKAQTNIYGAVFIDQPNSTEAKDLAEWAQANDTLLYDVFILSSNLNVDVSNVVWDIKLSSLTNYRMLYSPANNRRLATAYMARNHTVNFNAENSAITMHLKALPVSAEELTETEIAAAKTVGLDVYTTIKQTPVILTSGANDFVDNRYNFIGYKDALETDLFNLLKQTGTKIPQTVRGVNQLVDQAEKTTRGFVRAGVFAPETWTSPERFGDEATFNRNIEKFGFYFLAGRLSDQPQADRQARKSPVIKGAVKNAGAIHSANIIVNVNL